MTYLELSFPFIVFAFLIHKTCIIGCHYVLTYDLRFLIIFCRFCSLLFKYKDRKTYVQGVGPYQLTFEAEYILYMYVYIYIYIVVTTYFILSR